MEDIKYICNNCKDTGVVETSAGSDDEGDEFYTEEVPCICQEIDTEYN